MLRFKDVYGRTVWIDEHRIIMATEGKQEPKPPYVTVLLGRPEGAMSVELDVDAKGFQRALDSVYDDEVPYSSSESLGDTFINMGLKPSA